MILTVTLNPAVDKTYTISSLMLGQVNRIEKAVNYPGGKGINVSKILQQFQVDTTATGFIGGYAGRFIEDSLVKDRIACRFTMIKDETRSNTNIIGEDGYVTEILEPGPIIGKKELDCFLVTYRELCCQSELIVISGSIAKGIPSNIYQTLIQIAGEAGRKVLLDSSGEVLEQGIKVGPYLIKPNQKELEYIIKQKLQNLDQIVEAAVLLQKNGIEKVLVSLGEKGLLYIDERTRLRATPPKIRVMNTVGCGDSVIAAYALAYLNNDTPETALRRAAAISAANAMTLENGKLPMGELEELMKTVRIEEV